MTTSPANEQAEQAELAEARAELRVVARDLLSKTRPPAVPDWSVLAASGWLGLEVPAGLDGADATFAETAVIAEELGRAVACAPYLGSAILGIGTLRELAPEPDRDALLRLAAAGEARPVAVLADGTAATRPAARQATADGVPFWLAKTPGGGLRLHGQAAFVPDAADSTSLLMLARSTHDGAPVIVVTDPRAPGLTMEAQPVVDQTRQLARVTADGAEIAPAAVWRFATDPRAAVRRLHDRAVVAVACDSLGVAEAMLDATVSYAKVREQFGRPIGSFQAVKHACADMLVKVSVTRQLVTAAVTALAGTTAAGTADATTAAAMAKSYAGDAAVEVAGKAMQLHGGIGYTWESGIHLYLKRASLNRALFCSPEYHRRRLAARYR